jgi:hypothetical protein
MFVAAGGKQGGQVRARSYGTDDTRPLHLLVQRTHLLISPRACKINRYAREAKLILVDSNVCHLQYLSYHSVLRAERQQAACNANASLVPCPATRSSRVSYLSERLGSYGAFSKCEKAGRPLPLRITLTRLHVELARVVFHGGCFFSEHNRYIKINDHSTSLLLRTRTE